MPAIVPLVYRSLLRLRIHAGIYFRLLRGAWIKPTVPGGLLGMVSLTAVPVRFANFKGTRRFCAGGEWCSGKKTFKRVFCCSYRFTEYVRTLLPYSMRQLLALARSGLHQHSHRL
jgi:hypothetical protein